MEGYFPQQDIDELANWKNIVQIEVCEAGIIGLCRDGTVVVVKNPYDPHYADYEYEDIVEYTQKWKNVKKLVVGGYNFYALTYDGKVLIPGILKEP